MLRIVWRQQVSVYYYRHYMPPSNLLLALQFSHALDDSSLKTQCLQGLEGTDIRTDETLPPLSKLCFYIFPQCLPPPESEKIDEDSFELTGMFIS
jgi:hypothetical protein